VGGNESNGERRWDKNRVLIIEPVQEPMFCWCVGYWIKLQEWQNSMDSEMLCTLFAAILV
jgi:hypothetical protein